MVFSYLQIAQFEYIELISSRFFVVRGCESSWS